MYVPRVDGTYGNTIDDHAILSRSYKRYKLSQPGILLTAQGFPEGVRESEKVGQRSSMKLVSKIVV